MFKMNKLLILLIVISAACANQGNTGQEGKEIANEYEKAITTDQLLNNGKKWSADQATKKNVAEMVEVINDSRYADATQRKELYVVLQAKIDGLIKECRMRGPEHDVLHVWLEKVLNGMKELKEGDGDYNEARAALKMDIESFNTYFE